MLAVEQFIAWDFSLVMLAMDQDHQDVHNALIALGILVA